MSPRKLCDDAAYRPLNPSFECVATDRIIKAITEPALASHNMCEDTTNLFRKGVSTYRYEMNERAIIRVPTAKIVPTSVVEIPKCRLNANIGWCHKYAL